MATPATPESPLRTVPRFDHLARLTHRVGVWEHTDHGRPRREHGSCTDDSSRALVVACRAAPGDPFAAALVPAYLGMVVAARRGVGSYHNRIDRSGRWRDDGGPHDTHGRVWWALGVAAVAAPGAEQRATARTHLQEVGRERVVAASEHLRPHAAVLLGVAAATTDGVSDAPVERALARHSAVLVGAVRHRRGWPEPRLTYDNARLPEALLAAGGATGDPGVVTLGLDLLTWLVDAESLGQHFSFAPVGGRTPGAAKPGFDQQPIEAAAMASACARASTVTGDRSWAELAVRAAGWLLGANDVGAVLHHAGTGATHDGLQRDGVNRNRGAESTISGLEALLAARGTVPERPRRSDRRTVARPRPVDVP